MRTAERGSAQSKHSESSMQGASYGSGASRTRSGLARPSDWVGNQEMQRLLRQRAIQAKLKINQPADAFEREADRVADQVMRMSDKAKVGPKASTERIQPIRIQRTCHDCEEEVQRELLEEEDKLQTRKQSGHSPKIGPVSEGQIHTLRGKGQPLTRSTRNFFEPRFGRDLSYLKVHTDGAAAMAARAIGARAYTLGRDIVFGRGEYSPETSEGKRLLAHEIVHTIQQSGSGEDGIESSTRIQRTIGDGHDLTSPRFQGDPVLEACFDNERVLRRGDRGTAVATIQHALIEVGAPFPRFGVDGIFGSETQAAVRFFQRASGLTGPDVDGIIGPITMGLLDARLPTAPAAGPAPIPATPAARGTAPRLTAVIDAGPTPGNCGIMNFVIHWEISANAAPNGGFVVQDLTITWNNTDCSGTAVPDATGKISPLRYWEAWRVAPNSRTFSPVNTDTFQWVNDLPSGCTNDTVTFTGVARFHDNVAALPAHMVANNPATFAGTLQSSLADPNLGGNVSAPVPHNLIFHWVCCPCTASTTVVDAHEP